MEKEKLLKILSRNLDPRVKLTPARIVIELVARENVTVKLKGKYADVLELAFRHNAPRKKLKGSQNGGINGCCERLRAELKNDSKDW